MNKGEKKRCNDIVKSKTVLKKSLVTPTSEANRQHNLAILDEQKLHITEEIYVNGINTYRKFNNIGSFFKDPGKTARLLGYYVDPQPGRKLAACAWCADKTALFQRDFAEFDYIPFAFTKTSQSIFVNANRSLEMLKNVNDAIKNNRQDQSADGTMINRDNLYFLLTSFWGQLSVYNVQLITKRAENEYFENQYITATAGRILNGLYSKQNNDGNFLTALNKQFKFYGKYIPLAYQNHPDRWDYAIHVRDIVIDSILNGKYMGSLLSKLIQEGYEDNRGVSSYFISLLIKINAYIAKGGVSMSIDDSLKKATAAAWETVKNMREIGNEKKLVSYRKRLATALLYNDKKTFLDIVIQLSAYSNTPYLFLTELLGDFDGNINIAYAFTNALLPYEKKTTDNDAN